MDRVEVTTSSDERQGNYSDWADAAEKEQTIGGNESVSTSKDQPETGPNPGDNGAPKHHIPSDKSNDKQGNGDPGGEMPRNRSAPNTDRRGVEQRGRGYRYTRRGGRSWNQQRGQLSDRKYASASPGDALPYRDKKQHKTKAVNEDMADDDDDDDPPENKDGQRGHLNGKSKLTTSGDKLEESLLIPPPVSIRVSADDNDVFSIYYLCNLQFGSMLFWSVEQAYQWLKAVSVNSKEAAYAVYSAKKGTKTMSIAEQYFGDVDWSKWFHLRIPFMRQLLRAKARCCKPFTEELRNSGDSYIVVVLKDDKYWGIADGKGKNKMGSLLMELRTELDEALNADPEEDLKMINLPMNVAASSDGSRSHEMTVLLIGDSQLNGIDCKDLVPGVHLKKRIVPAIEETHQFIENEDLYDYHMVVLHLLSHDAVARCREDLLEAMQQLTDVISKRMKIPKIIISLAVYPVFSREKEYSKLADDINNVLFTQGKDWVEVSFRTNGLRLTYEECFTPDGAISKKAEHLLRNNLADTIHHHLLYRKPSHLTSKPSKTSASCEIPQMEGSTEEQNKDGAKQGEDPNKSAKVEIDEKLDPLKGKLIIVDRSHELSNYFQCDLYLYGIDFWSGEQAYQWRKAKFMGNKKAADEIYAARYANQASAIANRYFRTADMRGWQAQQIPVMQQMLRAKARCCKPFLDKLRTSGDSYIIIVMKGDNYWGIGNGKGKNIMGSLLMELRSNLDAALNAVPNEDGRMIDFGQERADRDDRDSEVAKVLVICDSQLFGIDFNNLIQDVKVSKIITPSVEEAHHFIEREDISKYDATLLHLLSKEMVCKPEEEVIQAMDDFTSVIRQRMVVPKVIISLAIYPLLSPDEEYSSKADAINKELCEQFGDCSEVTFRRNGLRLKYEDCFTPDGAISKRGEELLKNNLVDTIYHHLFGRQRYQRRHRWRMPYGEPSY
ncbi:hypothetical protein LSH36_233g03016 [Paralvinella palmiformis]|uniref:NADAR domain-containing protein n=1 Tax=Paralvinella palmiformis TaxID=53620 RepID=A0AAD9N3T7_9ANNE|nr:hypothetical protein LSH36_233g03016 [Paralvinella palmiformis]